MMGIIIKSVYVGLIILLSVGTIQAEDLKDGFMGTNWETEIGTWSSLPRARARNRRFQRAPSAGASCKEDRDPGAHGD